MFENLFPEAGINGWRIIANGGTAFFTVLASVSLAGVAENQALFAALIGAVVQGGLAAMQELKKQADEGGATPTYKAKTKKLPAVTLF